MKNKSKIFKTIQCAEIFEFDKLILKHEYIGWKKIDGSYSNSWANIHSQILELDTTNYNFIKSFDNGEIKILGNIQNQKREGKWFSFNHFGNLHQEVHYKNGAEDGEWIFYNTDGSIKKKEIYKNGKILEFIKNDEVIKFN